MEFCKTLGFILLLLIPVFTLGRGNGNTSVLWRTGQSISGLEEEIIRLKLELQNERASRVVALCTPQNYGLAEVVFNQLNNFSSTYLIMEKFYGDPYHEPLVGFTKVFHTLPDRMTAYQKWLELLEVNEGLLLGGMLVFSKVIQEEIASVVGAPPQALLDLNTRLDIYADTVLNIWAREIRRGNFDNAMNFGSPPKFHMIGRIFQDNIDKLVEKILGNGETEYFKMALEFVVNLRWNMHRYVGLKAVYDQLNDDRRLVVAFKIKETMNGCFVGPDPDQPVREFFKNLKESLPPNVQQLLWHERCDIKNKYYAEEYLYGDTENFDTNNKRMFTWIPKTTKDGSAFLLEAKINSTGDGLEFRIESKYWPDFKYFDVHTTGAGDGSIKKYVSLRKTSPSGYNWRVELSALDGEVMFFYLPLNSYLMADIIQHDSNRRNAILWYTTALDPTTHVWTLDCVPT